MASCMLQKFDLLELIEDAAEMVAPVAYKKDLEMVTISKISKQKMMVGDPLVLQGILINRECY